MDSLPRRARRGLFVLTLLVAASCSLATVVLARVPETGVSERALSAHEELFVRCLAESGDCYGAALSEELDECADQRCRTGLLTQRRAELSEIERRLAPGLRAGEVQRRVSANRQGAQSAFVACVRRAGLSAARGDSPASVAARAIGLASHRTGPQWVPEEFELPAASGASTLAADAALDGVEALPESVIDPEASVLEVTGRDSGSIVSTVANCRLESGWARLEQDVARELLGRSR